LDHIKLIPKSQNRTYSRTQKKKDDENGKDIRQN